MKVNLELVGQVVLAEWLDSHQWPGWHTGEPATLAVRCFSAGLLIHASDEAVVIAGHWTDEEERQRCGEMTIPASALVSVRALA